MPTFRDSVIRISGSFHGSPVHSFISHPSYLIVIICPARCSVLVQRTLRPLYVHSPPPIQTYLTYLTYLTYPSRMIQRPLLESHDLLEQAGLNSLKSNHLYPFNGAHHYNYLSAGSFISSSCLVLRRLIFVVWFWSTHLLASNVLIIAIAPYIVSIQWLARLLTCSSPSPVLSACFVAVSRLRRSLSSIDFHYGTLFRWLAVA